MCVFISVCVFIYMYVSIYICICVYIYMYTYIDIQMYTYVCICVCMYIYANVYIHVYIYICIYVCKGRHPAQSGSGLPRCGRFEDSLRILKRDWAAATGWPLRDLNNQVTIIIWIHSNQYGF